MSQARIKNGYLFMSLSKTKLKIIGKCPKSSVTIFCQLPFENLYIKLKIEFILLSRVKGYDNKYKHRLF